MAFRLVAARTMFPSILTAFQRIANSSDPLKLHYSSISYKPFLSLFNMTGVVQSGELPPAIGKAPQTQVFPYLIGQYCYVQSTMPLQSSSKFVNQLPATNPSSDSNSKTALTTQVTTATISPSQVGTVKKTFH